MTITEMHVTPIALSDPPLLNAAGLHAPYALRTVVELVSDDGLYGLGEVPGGAGVTGSLEACRESVIGHDPFQLTALELKVGRQTEGGARHVARVFSALEVACFDLMGKATGRPVVDLLGGKARDRVEFSAYLFFKYEGAGGALGFGTDPGAQGWPAARQAEALDADGVVAQARAMCDAYGFRSLKLKGGALEPAREVETVLALHDAFPGLPLRLDPNAVWSFETALRRGRDLAGVLEYYEDPVRGQAAMATLRRALDIPLATNMCTTSFEDLPGALELGSEDIILSDHHTWGGLRATVQLGRICQAFGRGLSMHSNSHAGISLAAMTHVAAALPHLSHACDTHYPWQSEEVVVGGFSFEDGALEVPDRPGLGVDLDREALAGLHERYLGCGLSERDDELAMQAKRPGWRFEETRW